VQKTETIFFNSLQIGDLVDVFDDRFDLCHDVFCRDKIETIITFSHCGLIKLWPQKDFLTEFETKQGIVISIPNFSNKSENVTKKGTMEMLIGDQIISVTIILAG